MKEDSFYFKKDLTKEQLKGSIKISKDIVYFPYETRFGKSYPQFWAFLNFTKEKIFTMSHYNFNALGLSTQVPAIVYYSAKSPFNLVYKGWNKFYVYKQIDPKYFEIFSSLEYMFFDSLIDYQNIFSDAFFNNRENLLKGIRKRAIDQKVNWDLILTEALKVNPKLKEFSFLN